MMREGNLNTDLRSVLPFPNTTSREVYNYKYSILSIIHGIGWLGIYRKTNSTDNPQNSN